MAIAVARQRLMTANFDYELAYPDEGVGSGFRYRSVGDVSAAGLAYNEPLKDVTLYDQPHVDLGKARVPGPFTVEAAPAPMVQSLDDAADPGGSMEADTSVARSGETLRQGDWRDELLKTGIRDKAGQHISFSRLEPLPGARWLHAVGETQLDAAGADQVGEGAPAWSLERVVVSFGPDHAPLEQRQVEHA